MGELDGYAAGRVAEITAHLDDETARVVDEAIVDKVTAGRIQSGALGGPTSVTNNGATCDYSHTVKDTPGWTIHHNPHTGTRTITTPTGRQYTPNQDTTSTNPTSPHRPRNEPRQVGPHHESAGFSAVGDLDLSPLLTIIAGAGYLVTLCR